MTNDFNPAWPKDWRYKLGAFTGMLVGGAALVGLVAARQADWPAPDLIGLALIPFAVVALQFQAAYRLIAAQDEFVRALTAKRIIVAAGATIAIATGYSALDMTGLPQVPDLQAWLIYPLFWAMFGVVTPLVGESRA